MFEPIVVPQLNCSLSALSDVKFHIRFANKIRRPEDWEDPLHLHNYYEIFFNLSSNATMFLDGRSYPLFHGSAIIVKPQQVHICRFHKMQLHEFFCLWIEVKKDSPLFSFMEQVNLSPIYSFDKETKSTITDLFFSLHKLSLQENTELECATCLLQILQLLKQHTTTASLFNDDLPDPLPEIMNYIQENFADISHVKDVALRYSLSPSTLNRWFRQYLHTTPHEYLEMHKLKYAETLLSQGSSVMEACMDAGFPDCSHFIALFRKKFGATPLQYKRNLR